MANNSIGAYAQGGSNDIGAYEKAAAGGLTVNCSLATMSMAEQAASLNLSRIVSSALATLGMTTYVATFPDNRTVNVDLATMTLAPLKAQFLANRDIQANTASLSMTTYTGSVTLTIIRRIACAVARMTCRTFRSDMPFAWMDGVMSEDEWWTRRRKSYWHRKVNNDDRGE